MKLYHLTKYVYYLLITLMILSVGLTVHFLYNNFYRTMAQSQVVFILSSQVDFETIDVNLWDKVMKKLVDKKIPQLTEESVINDPFKTLPTNQ